MIKVYDKVSWHVDAGEAEDVVVERIKQLFEFLSSEDLLSEEGAELYEIGIDASMSVHEKLLTDKGNRFMALYYDEILDDNADDFAQLLVKKYEKFSEMNI